MQAKLYPVDTKTRLRPLPDIKRTHAEMRKKGVTLELLWREYREAHPDGCPLRRSSR